MLNTNVRFMEEPAICLASALPDGKYDIWLRKGIGSEIKTDEEGNTFTEYYADVEAYGRFDSPLNILPGDPGYDEAFDTVAAWLPGVEDSDKPDEMEFLRQQVEQLTEANDMLTECVLEMSAMIYV